MITATPNVIFGIISPMAFLIIRVPVLFMHWGTGKFQERFQTRAGFYGAVVLHGLYNGLAILLFSTYLGWV